METLITTRIPSSMSTFCSAFSIKSSSLLPSLSSFSSFPATSFVTGSRNFISFKKNFLNNFLTHQGFRAFSSVSASMARDGHQDSTFQGSQSFFRSVLASMEAVYLNRNPTAKSILELVRSVDDEQICYDHFAFRTFGINSHGIDSMARIFVDFGYVQREELRFPAKMLKAFWFSPPKINNSDIGAGVNGPLPRIFISELLVDELSPQAQEIIRKYTDGSGNGNEHAALASCFGSLTWEKPSYSEFQVLARESEYAAWTLVNGYALNHVTISTHQLKSHLRGIKSLNEFIEEKGYKLNSEGGILKVSPDGLLLQSSTVADSISFEFSDGVKKSVPCSYIEFAERLVLPQYKNLPEKGNAYARNEKFDIHNCADNKFEYDEHGNLQGELIVFEKTGLKGILGHNWIDDRNLTGAVFNDDEDILDDLDTLNLSQDGKKLGVIVIGNEGIRRIDESWVVKTTGFKGGTTSVRHNAEFVANGGVENFTGVKPLAIDKGAHVVVLYSNSNAFRVIVGNEVQDFVGFDSSQFRKHELIWELVEIAVWKVRRTHKFWAELVTAFKGGTCKSEYLYDFLGKQFSSCVFALDTGGQIVYMLNSHGSFLLIKACDGMNLSAQKLRELAHFADNFEIVNLIGIHTIELKIIHQPWAELATGFKGGTINVIKNSLQWKVAPLCIVVDGSLFLPVDVANLWKTSYVIARVPGLQQKGAHHLQAIASANFYSMDRVEVPRIARQQITLQDTIQLVRGKDKEVYFLEQMRGVAQLQVMNPTAEVEVLREHHWFARLSKCSCAQTQVEFPGHIISTAEVSLDTAKVDCVLNWPIPSTVKALKGFLELTSYYRRVVQHYGVMSKSLTDLLKKDSLHWSPEVYKAFIQLKKGTKIYPICCVALEEESWPSTCHCCVMPKLNGRISNSSHNNFQCSRLEDKPHLMQGDLSRAPGYYCKKINLVGILLSEKLVAVSPNHV